METIINKGLRNFLSENGRLKSIPVKKKPLIFALFYLSAKLEPNKVYSEREINDIIDDYTEFYDPATLRRELYNKRFIDRKPDGSEYWLEDKQPTLKDFGIDEDL